jgi:hypothetical protein
VRSEGRDILAADVRGLFSTHTPRPVLRLGWEHALSDARDPWRVRLGLRDGRPTAGIGWTTSHARVDLAFGPKPWETAALTTTVEF